MSGNHNMFCSANNPIQREPRGISECADYMRRHNAWRRGDDSIEASDPRELGLNIDFAVAVLDAMSGHDHLMVIAAFRYCLGRMTYIVGDCASWLIKIWPYLSKETQNIIKRDLEEAFTRDDEDREAGRDYKALGHDCDRAEWSRVRKLWENK
jgi:hypothetical protein